MQMHKHFSDWYREAALEPNAESLPLRWSGVEAIATRLTRSRVEVVARLYCSPDTASIPGDSLEGFREPFQAADPTFPMRNNDVELRVLAGATAMCALTDQGSPEADALALGVQCGSFAHDRDPRIVRDAPERVAEYLQMRSISARNAPDSEEASGSLNLTKALEQLQTHTASANVPETGKALISAFKSIQTQWNSHVESAASAFEATRSQLEIAKEESQILWWVFSAYSETAGAPFANLAIGPASILAAIELMALTQRIPGPRSAEAFLHRVLSTRGGASADRVTPIDAARDVAAQYASALDGVELGLPEELAPVLSTIRSLQTNSASVKVGDANEPGVAGARSRELEPAQLAAQTYNELMLSAALAELQDP